MTDDDLDSLLNTLSLSSTEEKLLNIPSEELTEGSEMCSRSLIGKFLAPEEVIIKGLKTGMIIAWQSDFSIINLRKNVYQFIFASEDNLNQITEDGPWCFDGNLLVLRNWRDDWESCEFFFDESEFWVHIVGLPLKYCTASVGKRLISLFEGCKKVQIREEEVSGKRFFRLRIQVNILEPFRRVISLSSDDGKSCIRALIQYERLPNLCYFCGLCDHTVDICNLSKGESSVSETQKLPFGPWLNASRISSLLEELNLNELQLKVVEFENKNVNESDFGEQHSHSCSQLKVVEFENKNVIESDFGEFENKNVNVAANAENQETEESKASRFVWTIHHFSKLNPNRLYSDVFVVGGYKWRVVIDPKGNNVEFLSVYLDVADSASLPNGWSQYAQFSFTVVNQVHSKSTLKKETEAGHQFNQKESDWGFPSFMPLSELHDPDKGYLVNDTIIVEADVDVRKALDQKKETLKSF